MGLIRILAIDDDANDRERLEAVLAGHGFEVVAAGTVSEALQRIDEEKFDILLADMNIAQPGDGFALVSAMREAQPAASTLLAGGYADIGPALQAFLSRVDGCLAKPFNEEALVAALSAVAEGRPSMAKNRSVAQLLRSQVSKICEQWLQQVLSREDFAVQLLTREERTDHVPDLLEELSRRLEDPGSELSPAAESAARKHGRVRCQQGYTIPQILIETRLLEKVICEVIQENLLTLQFDRLIGDSQEIGQILQAQLELSIRAYQAQAPTSLQTSFSMLYKSPYLGVVIADEYRVIDANEAFLSMIGYSREQLAHGEVSWVEMTPPKYRPLDLAAIEQLREFGTCAPIEKEFILADGTILPFLIGAVRLTSKPLQWSAYVVNLTEQRRLQATEQKLREAQSRHLLINRLAHEVNNPLAALMFSTHLLSTHPELSRDMAKLVADATQMLDRVSRVVHRVLEESKP